jgi:hypothetical protein
MPRQPELTPWQEIKVELRRLSWKHWLLIGVALLFVRHWWHKAASKAISEVIKNRLGIYLL